MHRGVILSQRLTLAPRLAWRSGSGGSRKRFKTSSSSSNKDAAVEGQQQQRKELKWTERKEAPKWLSRMAPPKGGAKLPTLIEAAVIGVVVIAGYYAWFVDPPKPAEEEH